MSEQSVNELSDELDSGDPVKGIWILLGVIVLIIGAFIFLRSEPSDISSVDELTVMLTDGQPKVIEFYSNF
ncbi:MAG: hypothetical protein BroJett011_08640 [Chloroflexota bacterium]|nr:MAG: hypothetical protein BroJett011_08640 [Chloroflexota bacterium]